MKLNIDVAYLLFAAFAVLGMIEWVKKVFKSAEEFREGKDKRAILWVILLPVFSTLVAFFGDGGAFQVATNAVMILSFTVLIGYNIVKTVLALVGKVTGDNAKNGP